MTTFSGTLARWTVPFAITLLPIEAWAGVPGGTEPQATGGLGASLTPGAQSPPWVKESPKFGSWYRGSLLLADSTVIAIGLPAALIGGGLRKTSFAFFAATLPFTPILFTGPILHLTRRNGPRALASLAMRAGFLSVGVVLGGLFSLTCSNTENFGCRSVAFGSAAAVMLIPPTFIDGFLFSSGRHSVMGRVEQPRFGPTISPHEGGLTVGLSGAF